MTGRLFCPVHTPVHVNHYYRFRLGRWESVREHCRTAGIFLEDRTVVLSTGGDQRLHSLLGVLFL